MKAKMRLLTTKTAIAISIFVVLFPQLALATSPSFSCSSNLVVSINNGYSASCDGDFTFTDGVLQNDTSISLTAGGLLDIGANARLYAPLIHLYSPNVNINAGAKIDVSYQVRAAIIGDQVLNSTFFTGSNLSGGAIIYPSTAVGVAASKVGLAVSDEPAKLDIEVNPGASIDLSGSSQLNGTLNNIGGALVIQSPALQLTTSALNPDKAIFAAVSPVPEPSTYALMLLG